MSFSYFFDAEKISNKFIISAAIVWKMHGREVVSFYRVDGLTAYKYLRRIIVLFLVFHCIKFYNICNIYNIHRVYSIYKVYNIPSLLLVARSCRKMIIIAVSNEHGERFHQDFAEIGKRYQGKWSVNALTDNCWSLFYNNYYFIFIIIIIIYYIILYIYII